MTSSLLRFRFTFLFHPASNWSQPYPCEDFFDGVDAADATLAFESSWYRNVTDVKCEPVL